MLWDVGCFEPKKNAWREIEDIGAMRFRRTKCEAMDLANMLNRFVIEGVNHWPMIYVAYPVPMTDS